MAFVEIVTAQTLRGRNAGAAKHDPTKDLVLARL